MSKISTYFKEVWIELNKVIWPSRGDVVHKTIVVMVFSLIVAFFLGLIDYGLGELIRIVVQ